MDGVSACPGPSTRDQWMSGHWPGGSGRLVRGLLAFGLTSLLRYRYHLTKSGAATRKRPAIKLVGAFALRAKSAMAWRGDVNAQEITDIPFFTTGVSRRCRLRCTECACAERRRIRG